MKRLESQIKKGFRGKKHKMSDKENQHWLESPVTMSTFYYVDQCIIVYKQRSTKHTYRNKYQVTRSPLKTLS
jgi:hypothetical protein